MKLRTKRRQFVIGDKLIDTDIFVETKNFGSDYWWKLDTVDEIVHVKDEHEVKSWKDRGY